MARIGNYKLGKMLGVGTVGTVYRAKDRDTGQTVALKILLREISVDSHIARRFEREMSILQRLDHPHIVRYFSDGEHNGRLYYAMELVDAGSIKDELIIHGQLPWRQVCRYGIQICSALQHAHNHGIIHRDLKPGNLFMTETGDLKLGDFGIARDTHEADDTETGLAVGTYAYMAPEQIRADEGLSDKVDLYALGCLLYEMLTGRQPYVGANYAQIFDQHLQRDIPRVRVSVPDCPEQLEKLVVQLMAKDPDQRPFNARYVQGFLQQLLETAGEDATADARAAGSASAGKRSGYNDAFDASASGVSPHEHVSWSKLLAIVAVIGLIIGAAVLARIVAS
jgi:serine/threonine protein kinase